MDEDDFKSPSQEPEFEHLVPKSFVSSERAIKNRAINALDKIQNLISTIDVDKKTDTVGVLNKFSKILKDIARVIKDVDIHNKRCED